MTENKAIIAICVGHTQAEKAIAELQQLGFARTNLSVFGKAYASDGNVVGCYTSGGHLKTRGGSLAFWDSLWNLFGDGGFFLVPNIGPIAIAGPFVRDLVTTIDEGVAMEGSAFWERPSTASASPEMAFSGTRSNSGPASVCCLPWAHPSW